MLLPVISSMLIPCVSRLVMMLTDKANIKEVLLFPANKPLANTGVAATSAAEGGEQPLRVEA